MEDTTRQMHDAIMAAAHERWPEMPEYPSIVAASPGSKMLEMALYEPDRSMLLDPDKFLAEERPTIKKEQIVLEPVGPFMLGYGPISKVLYVGAVCARGFQGI